MLAEVLVSVTVGLSVLALFGRLGWPFELFTHFRPHYVVLAIAATAAGLAAQDQSLAFVGGYCILLNAMSLRSGPSVLPQPTLASKPGLTVVWANVWKRAGALERTLDWARAQNADIILIGEFPAIDSAGIAPDYPHRHDTGLDAGAVWTSRTVAFSRVPMRNAETLNPPGRDRRPFLRFATTMPDGAEFNIIAVHPAAPIKPYMLGDRNAAIAMLLRLIRTPYLIAGDFNATPWSPVFPRIPGQRVGRALLRPTWLTNLPLLGLAIDHIKVSPGVGASLYRVGPFLGSDHRALCARVHLTGG